ncbi:MAG: chemotaxis protein CheR [Deltaproteobacteria bacterium HGW-Deltaproteobacteria-18]|jgi:two-component system CheB/CheR fusion protein|nr:MAG: chemotaxis protein CheR [Deltaproteobacteria bacterium HGW-Deltaproteobacteria-18]
MNTSKKKSTSKATKKNATDQGTVTSPDVAGDFPESSPKSFPVVGIGASAGGLAAFEAFFSGMPPGANPDMAFVLVQHLSPDNKSILTDLVSRYTRMQVYEVEDGMVVQPGCVYIIPPGYDMGVMNGALQLFKPQAPRGHRLPIDFFFQSLALDMRSRAIGIVLSGTGSDGSHGLRTIKAEGGMVIAQLPESTEFDGMPACAIATGLVDFVLTPDRMAEQILSYSARTCLMPGARLADTVGDAEGLLQQIYVLLRSSTGHDFSGYKPSTVWRRIERRMAVTHMETVDAYVQYMQKTHGEADALFRDLLIGVTNFFRDPEAFRALEEQAIPQIFAGKPQAGRTIRVWVCGCSTGEEAYSIAILLQERMDALKQSMPVQIFATDIDSQAIAIARTGLYPVTIVSDMSPERLTRFFTREHAGVAYRVHKGLRDMLIFSEQDVIKDPPFSKLDLISCRNLMIYFGTSLQKRLIPLFHYALNPSGMLFLGTSEGIGDFLNLFAILDRKMKLYQRKNDVFALPRMNVGQIAGQVKACNISAPCPSDTMALTAKKSLRNLTERGILQMIELSGVLVDDRGDIFYQHGRTGLYLELAPGEVGISNIIRMAREGLRQSLTMALHKAVATRETVRTPGVRVKTNGHFTSVNLTVCPVEDDQGETAAPLYLVVFEEFQDVEACVAEASSLEACGTSAEIHAEKRIAALMDELRGKDEYLQATREELESANEELKSSNEEMQSVNEELQSTNEEMETSKEELQSVNEELATVNAELNAKVGDLTRLNDDMNNLLAGSGIATIFVDHKLRILRFTPTAREIINLIDSDVGRPVAHIVSNLVDYNDMVKDVTSVLDKLTVKEERVQSLDGRWFSMRIRPYRTLGNVIEGAVLTFVDMTEMKQMEDKLKKANAQLRLATLVHDASDAMIVQALDGRILAWNPGAERTYGWSEEEALRMNTSERFSPEQREDLMAWMRKLCHKRCSKPYKSRLLAKSGTVEVAILSATPLVDAKGKWYAIATIEREAGECDPEEKRHDERKKGQS